MAKYFLRRLTTQTFLDFLQAEFGLWTHSNDLLAYNFRQQFRPYVPYLVEKVAFTANYYIWDGVASE